METRYPPGSVDGFNAALDKVVACLDQTADLHEWPACSIISGLSCEIEDMKIGAEQPK